MHLRYLEMKDVEREFARAMAPHLRRYEDATVGLILLEERLQSLDAPTEEATEQKSQRIKAIVDERTDIRNYIALCKKELKELHTHVETIRFRAEILQLTQEEKVEDTTQTDIRLQELREKLILLLDTLPK
ncbi:MAG: hypothetical protein Q8Q18_00015 [bacterium]|nr:hypothetical protein [bacterium]